MPGNAAIYIADPSLLGSKLFDQIEGIRSYEGLSQNGSATGVRFKLDAGQVTMSFMPTPQIEQHLKGFSEFAQSVIKDKDRLIYALSRIRQVRFVLGCAITPNFDESGTIEDFLFRFNGHVNGMLFFEDTLFGYNRQPLGGRHAEKPAVSEFVTSKPGINTLQG